MNPAASVRVVSVNLSRDAPPATKSVARGSQSPAASLPSLPSAGDSRARRAPQTRAAVGEACYGARGEGGGDGGGIDAGRRGRGRGREHSWREGEAIAVAPPAGAALPAARARESPARGLERRAHGGGTRSPRRRTRPVPRRLEPRGHRSRSTMRGRRDSPAALASHQEVVHLDQRRDGGGGEVSEGWAVVVRHGGLPPVG